MEKKIKGIGYNNDGHIIFVLNEGKGKEYYNNYNLKFKGEYISGNRWNGIYYNIKGDIEFELKDGIGKGREYDNYGNLIFEGEYINGEKNGKCKEYYNNILIFEGEYLNSNIIKKGKEYYYNEKLKYEGEYLNIYKWNGKLYDFNDNIEYNIQNGKGRIKDYNYDGKLKFEEEYLNGKKNGKCKEYYDNGELEFEGEYMNGKKNWKM